MTQENCSTHEMDPKIKFRPIERAEDFDLDSAMNVALSKRSRSEAVNGFLYLAAGVSNEKEARQMRDRVIAKLASRGVTGEEWAQEIIAVLNDTIERTRGDIKAVAAKPVAKKLEPKPVILSREERKAERDARKAEKARKDAEIAAEQAKRNAMPGVFRNVTVRSELRPTQAKAELFFGYSKGGTEIVRVHAIKSGDQRILVPGSTYQLRGLNMPKVLERAIRDAGISFTQVMKEATEKRDELKAKEEEAAKETKEQEASVGEAA
ncbi:MAG: hypothetical protein V1880_04630 [Patescibacteria group bacterium]